MWSPCPSPATVPEPPSRDPAALHPSHPRWGSWVCGHHQTIFTPLQLSFAPLWVLPSLCILCGYRSGAPLPARAVMGDTQHGMRGRVVLIPAGIIAEEERGSGHRHANAASSTLPAWACITPYVRERGAAAELVPASLPACTSPELWTVLEPRTPGSHSLGIPKPAGCPMSWPLCPVVFP